jgi:ABC-type multidrug transport system fused ATPase/permease subunit
MPTLLRVKCWINCLLNTKMIRLFRYYLPYKRLLTLAIVCNMLMSIFVVVSIPALLPFLQILFSGAGDGVTPTQPLPHKSGFQNQLDLFFEQLLLNHGREGALLIVCSFLVFAFLGKNLFRYLSLYFLAPVRNGVVRDLRQKMLQKMLDLPLSFFSEERKGDLMSRFAADVQEIEWSIMGVMEALVREPIVISGSLAYMLWVGPSLTGFVFVLLLFSGVIIGSIGKTLRKQSGEAQSRLGTVMSLVEETLGGLRILKGFNAEKWQSERFGKENDSYAHTITRLSRRRDLASPLSEFLGISVASVLLWFGAKQVFAGEITGPTFITFLYAFYSITEPAKAFSAATYSIRKGLGALERVEAILDAPLAIRDADNAFEITEFKDKIEFRNVSFQYANAERGALENIQLEIPKGKIVALVGASGAGKSTMADLLPRFYDPSEGQIILDGKNIRDLRMKDLRALMGIVSQEAILFNDTVRNNIAFSTDDASASEVEAAAKAANAHEFIINLPEGYDTNIGDRGSKLSGGQRQRLTIARALLKNPPILILDEATSALDSESEKLVQAALERLLENRTALVIAHRLSTVQHANEIIVLDGGRIVERGTHDSLMQLSGYYRKLVDLQAIG